MVFIIPLASACAEKDILYTFKLIWYSFLSIVACFAPASNLAPNVPDTQWPGIITAFLGSWHHYLNTWRDVPPCNIPGAANNTYGLLARIKFLSNGYMCL